MELKVIVALFSVSFLFACGWYVGNCVWLFFVLRKTDPELLEIVAWAGFLRLQAMLMGLVTFGTFVLWIQKDEGIVPSIAFIFVLAASAFTTSWTLERRKNSRRN